MVLFSLLWLWSSTLAAAWCVNPTSHLSDLNTGYAGPHAVNAPGHHNDMCPPGSLRPLEALVGVKHAGGANYESSFAGGLKQFELELPAASLVSSVSAFLPPPYSTSPLYLLYQKLLLPYRG